jgi:S-DNA-T family DNA segregation ATPase FtsK/SpoIIIE
VELAEPASLGKPALAEVGSAHLPADGLGTGAMMLMFSQGRPGPTTYMMAGMMGASMAGMALARLGRTGGERRLRMRAERRECLRYLAQKRVQARQAATDQRATCSGTAPPSRLWTQVTDSRLWERRPGGLHTASTGHVGRVTPAGPAGPAGHAGHAPRVGLPFPYRGHRPTAASPR